MLDINIEIVWIIFKKDWEILRIMVFFIDNLGKCKFLDVCKRENRVNF